MITLSQLESADVCEDIFVNNEKETKKMFRDFAKKYHPDIYKESDTTSLFAKLNKLYDEALDKIEKGIWNEKNVLILERFDGKKYKLRYLKKHTFELGECYISKNHVIYVLSEGKEKYLENYIHSINRLRFASSKMEDEFKRYLPRIETYYRLSNDCYCMVLQKEANEFLLSDICDYYSSKGEKLDPKHCAWILSRLNNLVCFMKYNQIVLNGFSINSLFISPEKHTVHVYGGWWYCVGEGEKMIGTQKAIFDLMPVKEKSQKIATFRTDIESIRAIGRELNKDIPAPMLKWLENGSSDNAYQEFKDWNQTLTDSFGERRFVRLDISEKDIYNN